MHLGSQARFCLFNFLLTAATLLVMLLGCARATQIQFLRSTERSMEHSIPVIQTALCSGEVPQEFLLTLERLGELDFTRFCLTDGSLAVIYDSHPQGASVNFSRESYLEAWYQSGVIQGVCGFPREDGQGWVFFAAENPTDGSVIRSLQRSFTLWAVILLVVMTCASILPAVMFSRQMRTILHSIQRIRSGDYSQQISIGHHDELTLLAEEFNLLTQRLREGEMQQRRFVSDASHELKTPLASIKLLADSILQNDLDSATIQEFVGDISHEAERLTRLSSKLLSLQPIESSQDARQLVDLAPAVYQVVRMLTPLAQQADVTIDQQLEQELYAWMLEDDLHQIVYNLLENAIKYNRPGGRVHICLERQGTNVRLTVQDSGVGIPPESLELLFQRFYRVDKARSRLSGGCGLGLSIVREMVERNQGTIAVQSQPGVGSTFTAVFPRYVSA